MGLLALQPPHNPFYCFTLTRSRATFYTFGSDDRLLQDKEEIVTGGVSSEATLDLVEGVSQGAEQEIFK